MKPASPKPTQVRLPASALAIFSGLLLASQASAQSTVAQPAVTPQQLAEYDINKDGVLDASERNKMSGAKIRPTSAPEAPAAPPTTEDTITLSPFEVNAEKDDGFAATNAGTATKLGLDMKDVAAPYTVMTREFIDALGITNVAEATQWTTNGGSIIDGNGADVFNNTTMMNVRGVVLNAGQQKNYFLTGGTLDTYATERIDVGRGPNAVLFNVGANTALGGGISSQSKRARLDRDFETISFTAGSWDYYRTTLDVNKRLTDRLAIRANALNFQRQGWRHYEFEKTRGITVALTYKLTNKTELRVETSADKTQRAIPIVPIFDNLSGWDGVTVYDGPITNLMYGGQNATPGAPNSLGQTLTFNGEPRGVDRQGGTGSTPYYVWVPGQGKLMNWQNFATTRRGDATVWTPIYANGRVWSRNGDSNALPFGNGGNGGNNPGANTNGGEVTVLYSLGLPSDRFDRVINNSAFRLPDKRFTLQPDAPILTQHTRDVNFGISHRFTSNLFFELTGDANNVHDEIANSILGFRASNLDINKKLPDGSVNPNFLQPYTDANVTKRQRYINNAGLRANLAYIKDLGIWGHYTFNANGGATRRQIRERNYSYSLATNPDARKWQGGDDQIRVREYWYASERPYINAEAPNQVYRMTWAADRNSFTASDLTIQPRWVLSGWNDIEENTQNVVLATAAKYFQQKLVLTAGVRFDRYQNKRKDRPELGDLPVDWDGTTLIYRPDAPSDWRTLTYTPVSATGTPLSTVPIPATTRPRTGTTDNGVQARDPLYANMRFRNDYNNPVNSRSGQKTTVGLVYHAFDWLSAKANYGNSFVPPPTGAYELEGDVVVPQTGFAYDGRLTFNLFKNRLSITGGYYFNREDHLRNDGPIKGPINNLLGRNDYTDTRAQSRNLLGFPDILGTDYVSRKNTGVEFEVSGRITKGWRVMGSVGTGRIDDYDRYPLSKIYLPAHQAELIQVLQAAGGVFDPTQRPSNAPSAPGLAIDPAPTGTTPEAIATRARYPTLQSAGIRNEQRDAVIDFNNIWFQNEDKLVGDKPTIGLKRLRLNLFTDYTVQTGFFKSLRFGLGGQWSDQGIAGYRSGDSIPNPNYNPSIPTSTTNLTYADDPSVDGTTPVWIKQPLNIVGTIGYSMRLKGNNWLRGKELEFQFRVNNLLNLQQITYQDGGVQPRAPNGDFSQVYRVGYPSRPGSYQTPISFQLTTTLKL